MINNQIKTLKISSKQKALKESIISQNIPKIFVEGSTQSGKTFIIAYSILLYAQELYKYDPYTQYSGAIIGWSVDTIKGNIVDVMENFLNYMGFKKKEGKKKGDYILKYGEEKYLKIFNLKIYFFGFNNVLAFNKILGKPLILEWIDESARIYTQKQLQQPFNEFPGRQVSFAGHPYIKSIHSFNVEGGENHDYKVDYIDKNQNEKNYVFFPYDNPKLDTPEKIREVVNMFPPGSLREQKIFNKWVVAEGKVFTKVNIIDSLDGLQIREIGLGVDYGSVNPTTFVPIALCYNPSTKQWILVRLECYYHNPKEIGDTPTTEFYSMQLRFFMLYLKEKYPLVPITTNVVDSEATHYCNRLDADNIPYKKAPKGAGSVDSGVQHLQSLIYKGYFYILKRPNIKLFHNDGVYEYSGKDDSLLEFESYQYDTIKSVKEGTNAYKKENDHSIDATRYLIAEWKETGRCPIV
jgi:PBSX family phage terminase large subunit